MKSVGSHRSLVDNGAPHGAVAMPYEFLVWLIATLVQGADLGLNMHITMLYTDVENDSINPHDAANAINAVVVSSRMDSGGLTSHAGRAFYYMYVVFIFTCWLQFPFLPVPLLMQLWEYALEAFLAVWLLMHGRWILFLLPTALTVYHFVQVRPDGGAACSWVVQWAVHWAGTRY